MSINFFLNRIALELALAMMLNVQSLSVSQVMFYHALLKYVT